MHAVAARWDAKADAWDHELQDPQCHLNEDQAYARFVDQLSRIVLEKSDFCRAQGIVDAGCATGLVLAGIVSGFAWGVGVDISPQMIRRAQAKVLPHTTFLVGDCFDLAATCPKAGAVVSRGVLLSHYGPEQGRSLLVSARSCLVEGGFVLWDFLNRTGRSKYQHVAETKSYFDAEEVCALAGQAGLRQITVYGEPERRVRMLYAER